MAEAVTTWPEHSVTLTVGYGLRNLFYILDCDQFEEGVGVEFSISVGNSYTFFAKNE